AQRMGGEYHGILGVFNDIDLFAAQLANDGLHAHSLHSYASAHAVDIAVTALNRNLGALAGLPRAALDHYRAVVYLRNFLLEQTHHQLRRGTRHHHARAFTGLVHNADHAAYAVAHAVAFQFRLLLLGQTRFGLAEVQDVVRPFHALDGAVYQLT